MTQLEYEVLKEDVELWKDAREFIRTMSLMYGDKKCIEQAKALCAKLTKDIVGFDEILGETDEFRFETEKKVSK